jgi:hypothetical protein
MKVVLKRDLFFDGRLYRTGVNEIEGAALDQLPKDAKEYSRETAPVEEPKGEVPIALSQLGRQKAAKPLGT